MLLHMKNTLLFIALSLIIYLIDINYCDAQNQSSSLRGKIYDYDATGIRNRYRPSSLLRLESYPENLETQNLEYDSSEYVIDKNTVSNEIM